MSVSVTTNESAELEAGAPVEDPLFGVRGKVVLVTGGLGQIGAEFVREFYRRGAKVAVLARNVTTDKVEAVFGDLTDRNRLQFHQVDITRKITINAALDRIERVWGTPNVLVNNAGIDTQPSAPAEVSGPFEEFPEEVFRDVVDVNLVGTFLMTQAVGARMVRAGRRGSIINVGSIYGVVSPVQDFYAYQAEDTGVPFFKPVAYSAAKSRIYNLTRYCATYWGKAGIRVNTLTPSGVFRDTQDKRFQANYCARMPVGRMAEPDEFNGAVVFLAADASRYMTGANLVVDGGWTAW